MPRKRKAAPPPPQEKLPEQKILPMLTALQHETRRLGAYWFNQMLPEAEHDTFLFSPARARSVSRFIVQLGSEVVQEYIDLAFERLNPSWGRDEDAFRYFCACCWNAIRSEEGYVPR